MVNILQYKGEELNQQLRNQMYSALHFVYFIPLFHQTIYRFHFRNFLVCVLFLELGYAMRYAHSSSQHNVIPSVCSISNVKLNN